MKIRLAEEQELNRVNELRRQVNALHAAGKPEIFRPEFSQEMRDFLFQIWNDPEKDILVAEREGEICGFAILHHVQKPENPVKRALDYLDIDEFGVDEACRRQGVAREMIASIREYAKSLGLQRIELNMWEFNQDALAFYEAVGFHTYRRYLELSV